MATLFSAEAARKGLTLTFQIDPKAPPAVVGDVLRLGQVLTNLLGNALKFTPQGRVEARILRLGGTAGRARLRFEVQDTGIGIDAEHLDQLFQPFFQVNASTTRRYGGSGLGLVISRKLVEAMGGALQVDSTPGQGSLFFFELTLPEAADHASEAASAPGPAIAPCFAGASILLAEDNALNQEVARRLLEKTGAKVTVVPHGAEAVYLADRQPFDLVLMDLQMPVMDGFEATRRIRQRHPELPVIALSAAVMEADREQSRAAGMNAHLAKPIESAALYRILAAWLPAGQLAAEPPAAAEPLTVSAFPNTLSGFDVVQGLRHADGDADLYHELLLLFKEQLNGEFAVIVDALAEGHDETAGQLAHTLKGAAGAVEAARLAQIATAINDAWKSRMPITATMREELSEALTEAQAQLANLPARRNG
jgi:CheY-like chemotaxis protein/HPt (histidine-containing phosphotransfer) domain-containing protein